jgi:hypothetical protein
MITAQCQASHVSPCHRTRWCLYCTGTLRQPARERAVDARLTAAATAIRAKRGRQERPLTSSADIGSGQELHARLPNTLTLRDRSVAQRIHSAE